MNLCEFIPISYKFCTNSCESIHISLLPHPPNTQTRPMHPCMHPCQEQQRVLVVFDSQIFLLRHRKCCSRVWGCVM